MCNQIYRQEDITFHKMKWEATVFYDLNILIDYQKIRKPIANWQVKAIGNSKISTQEVDN